MRICATRKAAFAACFLLLAPLLAQAQPAASPPRGASAAREDPPSRSGDAVPAASPSVAAAPGGSKAAGTAAAPDPVSPVEMSGIERPSRHGDEAPRAVANAILWPFRLVVDLVFLATGAAGALLENDQIVPRTRDFFFTRGGEIGVFPTVFLETGTRPNIGARLIVSVDPYAATVRAGYGGPDENVVETRMRLSASKPFPAVLSLEGLHDRRTGLGYLGIGQTPWTDPRNDFRNGAAPATYRERRERVIGGLGLRPFRDVEVFLSSSLTLRHADDPEDPTGPTFAQAFAPGSVDGPYRTTRMVYTEMALRIDTRATNNGVDPGLLVEGYQGLGVGIRDDPTRFGRAGFRLAAFLPFIRRTTILSPKIVVDGLTPIGNTSNVPFQELVGQPTFRGFDNRRDYLSVVASLDYRWYLSRFVSARLFGDLARVAPSIWDVTLADWRWASGFGFDLHTSTSQVGRVAIAGSSEGFHFLLAFGVPAGFGDRQHRD